MTDLEKQNEFINLLELSRVHLSRFVRAMTLSREEAQDIVSETILLAFQSFDKIKNKDSFKSYLFTIASRLVKRKVWRNRIFGIWNDETVENMPSKETSPDLNYDVEQLYAALKKLPPKQEEALVLFEISGFSIAEIQEIQGGTISGIKTRLKRGREKLAHLLGANQGKQDTEPLVPKKNGKAKLQYINNVNNITKDVLGNLGENNGICHSKVENRTSNLQVYNSIFINKGN